MVQALVKINEKTNRILNMVKAQYRLKDKGEAIRFVVQKYVEKRPELKLIFREKIQK